MPNLQDQAARLGRIHDVDGVADAAQAEPAHRQRLFPVEADGAAQLRNLMRFVD
jgi:hypothetical protein